jgi:ubiquinol-cytochrome c reductase cytochrome c1 subunit
MTRLRSRLRPASPFVLAAFSVLAFALAPVHAQESAAPEAAQEDEHEAPHYPLEVPDRQAWSFAGPFGTYDAAQLQRGLQVFQQVCSGCHGLHRVAFRTLASEGGPFLSEEQMRAVAANFSVIDADTGERRPARPADYFPQNTIVGAPDLSLMAKARASGRGFGWLIDWIAQYQEAGPNYIYALLTGYGHEPPEGVDIAPGTYFNPYFIAGPALSMPPPLSDGQVRYADGTPETADQYARDVAAFLMWAAEPTLVDRKRLGFQVMVFLVVFAGITYLAKRRVWRDQH